MNRVSYLKKAFLIVALSFLIYNIYQAFTTTIFVAHFPLVVQKLPQFIQSSQPVLQLALFLFQEIAGSVGSYLRLVGSVFALYAAALFFKNDSKYLSNFRRTILLESLYFLLLLPASVNHLVGSVISGSAFLNFYTGVSCLLQAVLIFPALFILSRKLKNPENLSSILKWAGIAAPLYVFGFWVRHGLLWVYAISPSETPPLNLVGTVGFADSLLALLAAAIVCTIVCLSFRQKKKLDIKLAGTVMILAGIYFVVYDLVSVWNPIYRAFLPLTDFWMVTLLVLGAAVLLDQKSTVQDLVL